MGEMGLPLDFAQARVSEAEDTRLIECQRKVSEIVHYLEQPGDEWRARELVKERCRRWWMECCTKFSQIKPCVPEDKRRLFDETYSGPFMAHKRTANIHTTLSWHY